MDGVSAPNLDAPSRKLLCPVLTRFDLITLSRNLMHYREENVKIMKQWVFVEGHLSTYGSDDISRTWLGE